jgi:broad specificity phosphatase PhoE
MTTLHLIRHGRAQAQADDYDQLHEVGEVQARLLGAHLAATGQRFDAVYVGPLRRQRETLRLMREAGGAVGLVWPEAQVLDGLAEGPFEVLYKKYMFERLKHDPVLQAHVARLREVAGEREAMIELMFAHMVALWTSGEVHGPDVEPAPVFEARVHAALAEIERREGFGREIAVVTSNGVIGACVRRALGSDDGRHAPVHNASVTRIELLAGGLALRAHDVVEHLTDPAHRTLL